jgi:hypothetical protein
MAFIASHKAGAVEMLTFTQGGGLYWVYVDIIANPAVRNGDQSEKLWKPVAK